MIDALRATVSTAKRSPLYRERLRDVDVLDLEGFGKLPLTTRADLQAAGLDGTRAAPIEDICHYGETSGTSGGGANSTWLTAEDLSRNARAIGARHPDIFAPGTILLNRFPFMAAPAHLIQLIAQQGGGVSIPAGNINWDVPFPRALELAERTGARVLAGLPLEPIVLGELARARGLDPARDLALDTFFLGGAPLPPVLQERIERLYDARVVELYGSTETMLLGTSCAERTLHLEPDLVYCEFLNLESDEPAPSGTEARLIVTTIGLEGSPLVRLETGDVVRRLPPCSCGDPRPAIVVLGRHGDASELDGHMLYPYEIIEASATAADVLDSSVFFAVVLPDRLLVRVEAPGAATETQRRARAELLRSLGAGITVELECTERNTLLDVEQLGRSPSVYKPILVSDWTKPGRQLTSVSQGMMEWPSLGLRELFRWLSRGVKAAIRRRELRRELRVAKPGGRL